MGEGQRAKPTDLCGGAVGREIYDLRVFEVDVKENGLVVILLFGFYDFPWFKCL